MSKKGTGNWKPLAEQIKDPLPVPVTGTVRGIGKGQVKADIVLPIDPYTLQIVPEEEE